jgi:hypothetical protein
MEPTTSAVECSQLGAVVLLATIDEVCKRIELELAKVGVQLDPRPGSDWLRYVQSCDPFDKQLTMTGLWEWNGDALGSVQLRADGGVYGEYFVTQPHPTKAGAFIEAVTVWGGAGSLRSELRLVAE